MQFGGFVCKRTKELGWPYLHSGLDESTPAILQSVLRPHPQKGKPILILWQEIQTGFWCSSGFEERLKELDLSNWLCGITVLSSLVSVNSPEVKDLSSTTLG